MGVKADPYALPATKVYIEPCMKAALALHPGRLEEQRMLHRNDGFFIRYTIEERNGSKWMVLCDGSTGKIVSDQKLYE